MVSSALSYRITVLQTAFAQRDNTISTSSSAKTSSRHCSACKTAKNARFTCGVVEMSEMGNSTASQHSLKQRLQTKQSRKHEQSAEEYVVQLVPGESQLPSLHMEKLTEEVPPREHREVSDKATSPITSLRSSITCTTTQIPAASSSSFLVNALPSWDWKPPTLGECQVIIRQLWSINQMQAQQVRLYQVQSILYSQLSKATLFVMDNKFLKKMQNGSFSSLCSSDSVSEIMFGKHLQDQKNSWRLLNHQSNWESSSHTFAQSVTQGYAQKMFDCCSSAYYKKGNFATTETNTGEQFC
ncbi:uncharacterized protein LOC112970550 isoform X9 [Apteryx rowi]|uniref:uncharacterized protein LOC112970550 isoform X9 n=1 Tax=Apteryx rowi TaxID=308060 RepID=UPI000E1CD8EE|nr:uncharacterized protein LOC112970550 isoform X9 [Apteryx rowi]